MSLTPEELELRFFKSMNEFQIREWVENLSSKPAEFILFLSDEEEKVVGFGQVSICRKNEVSGDIALSLDSSVRGQGLGLNLFRQLLNTAKKLELDKLYIMFKSCNHPVKALVSKFGFELNYSFGDVEGVMI